MIIKTSHHSLLLWRCKVFFAENLFINECRKVTQIQFGHSKMKLNQDVFLKQTFFWGLNVNKLCSNHSIVTCTNAILAQFHTHFTIWNVIRSFVYKKYELSSLLKWNGLIDFVSKGYQRRMEGRHSRVARRATSTII